MNTRFLIFALLLVPSSLVVACSSDPADSLGGERAQLEPGGAVSSPGASSSSSSSGGSKGSSSSSSTGSSSGVASSGGTATSSGGTSSSSGASAADDGGTASALEHCVDVINTYRATLSGVAPYTRSSDLEQFAAEGAQSDSQTGEAHGHFISTNGGNGIAFAENEVPGWPLDQYGSITAVIDQGMQMMWAEGPGGGHYDNMSSTQYTQAGCGIYVTSDNSVWITTDFK